ncbi:MAG: helix-turn-helix domain-containing protein [Defluviitaleaceae bacterium]|nr:helix-turn-helix domain-containing protein [Defluviitaleaceae bacterium]
MEVLNCPRCRKVFVKRHDSICDTCVKEEEHIFDRVRDYIKENPDKTVSQVAEICEVSVKRIIQYIRDGRIEAGVGMSGDITCSKCGKPILIGRMCEKCILETNFMVNDMKNEAAIKNRGRIFTTRR